VTGRVSDLAGRAKVDALVERYSLPSAAAAALLTLLELLATDPLAPTAIRDRSAAADDHLADSLVALDLERLRVAVTVADIGSGAGFPGLPLAVALPEASFSLVEANARKCRFIERAAEACGLTNATVVPARAEAWPEGLGRFDVVTVRALAPPPVVAEYAAPLLRIGGALVAWRGGRDPATERAAVVAAHELGLEPAEPRHVVPYPGVVDRSLDVVVKVRKTPARFPRRPGIARKRPLGSG
jgi:16S rRNA (guanine527-N7)-methyltransferase